VNWPFDITKYCKDFFIPCEENNYKPRSLKGRSFFVLVVIIVAIKLLGIASYFEYLGADIYNQIAQADIYALTNQVRQDNGLNSLKVNPALELSAQLKANDMVQTNYFGHESPSGVSPWYWFDRAKYGYTTAGENLAMNFISSKEVVNAWLNSETHKKNLLYKDFSEIGVAITSGKINNQETILVVQHFAKPTAVASVKADPVKSTKPVSTVSPKPKISVAVTPSLTPESKPKQTPISLKSASSNVLHNLLILIGVFTGLLLILKVFVAIKIQYPVLIIRGVVLILLCWTLIYFKDYQFLKGGIAISTGDTIIINDK
jgi:hypothetical protein